MTQVTRGAQTARGRHVSWKHALFLVAGGTIAALLLIELSVRIATRSLLTWESKEAEDCCITDPMVGRLIKDPGKRRHPIKGFTMTIGEHGIRLNGTPSPSGRPTLVVGDSFAFGDGVDDQNTWPAVLERLSGRPVINAGMIAFGLDQAVLRAEQLFDVYVPDTIIVAFIPHDVLRCEMSYWSGFAKPYFDVTLAGLALHPAEAPEPPAFAPMRRVLARSMALDILFPKFLHWEGPEVQNVHHRGPEVACLLMQRLAAFSRTHEVQVVILAHPQQATATPQDLEIKNGVLACAAANQLATVDVFPVIELLPPVQREQLFDRHFTADGYHLMGQEVAHFLTHRASEPGVRP